MCPHVSAIFRNNSNNVHVVVIGNSCRHDDMCAGSPLGTCLTILWSCFELIQGNYTCLYLKYVYYHRKSDHILVTDQCKALMPEFDVHYVSNIFDFVTFPVRPK